MLFRAKTKGSRRRVSRPTRQVHSRRVASEVPRPGRRCGGSRAAHPSLFAPGAGRARRRRHAPARVCLAMIKIAFGDCGRRAGLTANIDAVAAGAAGNLALGRRMADEYLKGRGPFPERLAITGLLWRYLWEVNSATERWAEWARAQVATWPPEPRYLDPLESFRAVVEEAGLGVQGGAPQSPPP